MVPVTNHHCSNIVLFLRCEPESCLPAYIGANIHYRLPLPGLEWRPKVSDLVPLHNTEKWPQAEELGLNYSQYAAYKAALTQEFTVIQGKVSLSVVMALV